MDFRSSQALDAGDRQANLGASAPSDAQQLLAQTEKLQQLNTWFEVALNNMARGLSMFDSDRRLIVCNSLYREIYGLPEHLTTPGTRLEDLVTYYTDRDGGRSDGTADGQRAWIENHISELRLGKTFTHTQHLRNGRVILVTNQPLADGGWVDIQEDVTEKTAAAERINWLARHCPLTEVANRFHLREKLDAAIANRAIVAVHVVDLDRFKGVNDTHGHAAGDALLQAVARRMCATVRADDVVGRLGGDEFAIIQMNLDQPEQAETMARRLVKVLNAPYRVLGNAANAGASIGIAVSPRDGEDSDTLLKKADLALYRVKSSGRGSYATYSSGDDALAATKLRLDADLARALERNELAMHYQPIIDIRSGKVTSCEALMRWTHQELGPISPATFIPVAERSNLILSLGAWALHRACLDAADWSSPCKVTVNISAIQLERGDLVSVVEGALAVSQLEPCRLELEVTETAILKSEGRVLDQLERIRSLGVRVSLDDFGTAFSTLSYLRDFTFDTIKIDRSFVRELSDRRDCAAIVHAAAGLARALEIGAVAEGVETAQQVQRLSDAGCREVQGFFFSPAVPSSELEEVFRRCSEKMATLELKDAA